MKRETDLRQHKIENLLWQLFEISRTMSCSIIIDSDNRQIKPEFVQDKNAEAACTTRHSSGPVIEIDCAWEQQ